MALVASIANTDQHYKALAELMAPQGKYGIDRRSPGIQRRHLQGQVDLDPLAMDTFTRSSFQTSDMIGQHHLLNDVADLVDKGVLRTTLDQSFGTINAANLKRAQVRYRDAESRAARSCWRGGRAAAPTRRVG